MLFKGNLRGQPAKSYEKIKTRMEVAILLFRLAFLVKMVDKHSCESQRLTVNWSSMCRINLVTSTSFSSSPIPRMINLWPLLFQEGP